MVPQVSNKVVVVEAGTHRGEIYRVGDVLTIKQIHSDGCDDGARIYNCTNKLGKLLLVWEFEVKPIAPNNIVGGELL